MEIIKSKKSTIDFYYEQDFMNQSLLKTLQHGIVYMKKKEQELSDNNKSYFKIGSAVDSMLTGDWFGLEYYVSNFEFNLSDTEQRITESVYNKIKDNCIVINSDITSYYDIIVSVIDEMNYQSNWKLETRVKKIVEKCSEYFRVLVESNGRIILTNSEYDLIVSCVNRLKEVINNELSSLPTNSKVYYQLPLYFNYNDINCKSLLDMVIVTESIVNGNTVIDVYPIDIKTTASTPKKFIKNSFFNYGYDFQADFYTLALYKNKEMFSNKNSVVNIHDMRFIVVCTNDESKAFSCIYNTHRTNKRYINNDNIVLKYLNLYKWHIVNNEFNNDKELSDSNYVLRTCAEERPE